MWFFVLIMIILFIISLIHNMDKKNFKENYKKRITNSYSSTSGKSSTYQNLKREYNNVKYLGGHPLIDVSKVIDGSLYLLNNEIRYTDNFNKKELFKIPLNDIKNCCMETKESITATRLLLTGIFAFALKKKRKYIRVEFKNELNDTNNLILTANNVNQIISDINKTRLNNKRNKNTNLPI